MSAYDELMNIARSILLDADATGGRLRSGHLADVMMKRIDPDDECPPLPAYGARATCVQLICRVAREEWGDVNHPLGEKLVEQMSFKEFTSELQARYAVEKDGEAEYVAIDELTSDEVAVLYGKMRRIGDHWHRHADQFMRYHRARTAKLVS